MFKKAILSLLLSLLLTMALVSPVAAVGIYPNGVNNANRSISMLSDVTLNYTYTDNVTASLVFSGNTAYCMGTVTPGSAHSVSVTATLYKQDGSAWDYIASWSGTSTGGARAIATGSATVTNGVYKVTTRGYVGNGLEYPTVSIIKTK